MKIIKKAISIVLALILGFIVGWRATIINGVISVDKGNNHIGYFECWGQVDEYYIEEEGK